MSQSEAGKRVDGALQDGAFDSGAPHAGAPNADEIDADEIDADEIDADAPDANEPNADEIDADEIAARAAPATIRRSPRYGRFILVGVLAGAALAAVAAILGPEGEILGRETIFLLLFLAFGLVGAVAGSVTAVLVDRPGPRRSRRS